MHTALQDAQTCLDTEEVGDDFAAGDDFDYDDELVGDGDRVIINDLLEDGRWHSWEIVRGRSLILGGNYWLYLQ